MGGLATRRHAARRRLLVLIAILALVLVATGVWGLWRPQVRIKEITISNGDQTLVALAEQKLTGTYFGIIPRDSIFFAPKHAIRSAILAERGDVAAVSIARSGFAALTIRLDLRTPVARWCGATYPAQTPPGDCYLFDASGFIYQIASSTDTTLIPFALFAPLIGMTSPIGATIADADKLPSTFDFARQIGALGSPVSTVVIRGDEVDDFLASATRVTYVLGDEQNAFTLLSSAKSDLNLSDGSVDYVDLRFTSSGRVYFKKK